MLRQALVLGLLAVQVLSVHYELDVMTGSKEHDGTDGKFEAVLIGKKGTVDFGQLDNPGVDDFKVGAMDHFDGPVDSEDIGKLQCVKITAKSHDMWMVDYVVVTDDDRKTYMYNTDGSILSTDPSEGKAELSLCKQGNMKYTLEITTAKDKWADTDNIHARVTLSSSAEKGNVSTAVLDNRGVDDFVSGATDTFVVRDLKWIGDVGCIVLNVDADDAWLFDSITVKYGLSRSKTFTNTDKVWLSSDLSEGTNRLELCDK